MRILLDMDSTLVDLNTKWFSMYNLVYGDNIELKDITDWDTHKIAKHGRKVYEVLKYPTFFRHLSPLPGAIEAFHELDKSHEVFLCTTSLYATVAQDKILWAEDYLGISSRRMFICREKHLIQADVIVDDRPRTLENWIKDPNRVAFSIEYPYNKGIPGVHYGKDWKTPEKAWEQIVKGIKKL